MSRKSSDKQALIEEFERLRLKRLKTQECPFFFHNPWGDQARFHESPAQIRLLTGGNRTGKTLTGAIELISYCMGVRHDGSKTNLPAPPVETMIMVRDRGKAVDKIIMRKIRMLANEGWIERTKKGHDGHVEWIIWKNGSRTFIGSSKQDADSFEGGEWHFIWFDEPPPREHWIALRRGLLDYNGRAIFTCTALKVAWLKNEIWDKADGKRIDVFELNLYESPFFTKQQVDDFADDLDPDEIEARIYGKFSHLSGRIFKMFDRKVHVVENQTIPYGWPRYVVMDPHSRRPSYLMWATMNPKGQIIIYDEWPDDPDKMFYEIKSSNKSVRDYATLIRLKTGPYAVEEYIIDPNFGKTPSMMTGNTYIEEFMEYDIDFYAEINNDIHVGHERITDRLRHDIGEPGLLVMKRCKNMIAAFENYSWDEKSMDKYSDREKPSEHGKDMIDAVRYLLDYDPEPLAGYGTMGRLSPGVPGGSSNSDRGVAGYG